MLETIFLTAAVIGGVVMACQFLLSLLGMGDDGGDFGDADGGDVAGDADAGDWGHDHGHAGGDHGTSVHAAADAEYHHADSSWLFGVLSFRTLVAASAFFGISGMAALSAGMSSGASLVLALAVGFCAMYGMYWLMRGISRLTASGNQRIGNALGRRATVYVPIPAAGSGRGKVQLSLQNRIVEFQAVTDEEESLKTGDSVEVVAVAGSDVVSVRRAAEAVDA